MNNPTHCLLCNKTLAYSDLGVYHRDNPSDCQMTHVINKRTGKVVSFMFINDCSLSWWYSTGRCVYNLNPLQGHYRNAVDMPWLPSSVSQADIDKYLVLA